MTVAGMVLVNNPGSWAHIYWPLEHAEWNGWTPTDLIFPFFLFIVGVAIPLAFGKRIEREDSRRALFFKVLYRSAIIFLLGEFLAGFPYFHFSTIRIPGVLQRIAVCYFFASVIFLTTNARTQAISALVRNGTLPKSPGTNLDRWGLQDFIEVAGHLQIIHSSTVSAANLARDFRNDPPRSGRPA